MKVITFILGELQTNCYIVIYQNTNQCLIIDPADEANFISEQILRQNLKPTAIIATHGHFDHILAADELQMAFAIPFYIHQRDLFLVKNLQKSASFWTKRKIVEKSPEKISFFQAHTRNFAGLKIIHTPGHTPGSVCLYFPEEKTLFTGDTLFANGVGRTDFAYSSEKDLLTSLKNLSQLPPETKLYPGHGESKIFLKNLKINLT